MRYKIGDILNPSEEGVLRLKISKNKKAVFKGYNKEGHLKLNLIGIKSIYIYSPDFWEKRIENQFTKKELFVMWISVANYKGKGATGVLLSKLFRLTTREDKIKFRKQLNVY